MSEEVKDSEEACAQSCPCLDGWCTQPLPLPVTLPACWGFRAQNTRKLKGNAHTSHSGGEKKNLYGSRDFIGYFKLFIFSVPSSGNKHFQAKLGLWRLPPFA